MMKIVAVYDEDPLYAGRFSDYVNQKEGIPFTAMAFSDVEKLAQFSEEHTIEILLAGENSREKLSGVRAKQVMVLCDGKMTEPKEEPSIYKYQSGDNILREMMACYCTAAAQPSLALAGRRALVLGVYSPVSRCRKSALALTLGQVLSKNSSVLYLNLEEFSGFSRLVCPDCRNNLSDVLYLYQQGEFNWLKLKSMVYSWGDMDYIAPVRFGEDLEQLTAEELAELLGRISRESGYERLVVDLGQLRRGALALLEACDAVYMPVLEDFISQAKLEEFEEYLSLADDGRVKERIQRLHLPAFKGAARQQSYKEQLLWGEMGDFVRQLLEGGRPLDGN